MKKEVESILKVLPKGCTVAEAVNFLFESGVIHRNAPRYAEIFDNWKKHCKDTGPGKAVVRTSVDMGVSDRAIYHARNRFERP